MRGSAVIFLFFSMLLFQSVFSQSENTHWVYPAGIARLYVVYVPASYQPGSPIPLVINIHGWVSTSGAFMRRTSDLRPFADTANFLVAYPNGLNFRWNSLEEDGGETDIRFLKEMMDDIEERYTVDPDRIYATGHNDGGELAHMLGCRYSDRIAAVASIKGSISRDYIKNQCNVSRPVPILKVHNTNDFLTPFRGDERLASVDVQIDFFTGKNNCTLAPEVTTLPDIDPFDSITVERYVFSGCDQCADVELILELDSTSSLSYYYPISTPEAPYYFDSREEIWRFFRKYTLQGGCRPTSTADALPADFQIFPNPAGDQITIAGLTDNVVRYTLYSLVGAPVLEGTIMGRSSTVDISGLTSGIYYFSLAGQSFRIIKTE